MLNCNWGNSIGRDGRTGIQAKRMQARGKARRVSASVARGNDDRDGCRLGLDRRFRALQGELSFKVAPIIRHRHRTRLAIDETLIVNDPDSDGLREVGASCLFLTGKQSQLRTPLTIASRLSSVTPSWLRLFPSRMVVNGSEVAAESVEAHRPTLMTLPFVSRLALRQKEAEASESSGKMRVASGRPWTRRMQQSHQPNKLTAM